jgi:hypothetical protein
MMRKRTGRQAKMHGKIRVGVGVDTSTGVGGQVEKQ